MYCKQYTNGNCRGQIAMKYGFIFLSKDKTGWVGGGVGGFTVVWRERSACTGRGSKRQVLSF